MIHKQISSQRQFFASCFIAVLFATGCGGDKAFKGLPVLPPAGALAGSAALGVGGGIGAAPSALCAAGQMACITGCADVTLDPRNCGQCARSCGTGACVAGQCVCPGNLSLCNGGCLDASIDPLNCGSCMHACAAGESCLLGQCMPPLPQCNPACVNGQMCVNNSCQCPANQMYCGDACADLQTTPRHCGTCDTQCAADQLCTLGKCACAAGQMLCGKDCVDLQTSGQHCGDCATACSAGEACTAGKCRAAAGDDGCSGGSAHDLNLLEVAAYQSLKVPLTKQTTAIDPTMRVADVVQGRPTLFRVFVSLGTGFVARELSARVTLKNGTEEDQYFARQTISKSSTDADTASTFQVYAPADKIKDATTYTVEVVECGTGTIAGSVMQPRFPAGSGDSPLSARKTGILKVTVIPVMSNSMAPDTSDTALAVYKAYLEAMYPIENAELTVGKQITTSYPINWETLLEQIRSQRAADKPANDVYYYGFLKPADTFKNYCRSGCTAGIGYVASATQAGTRAAVGLAYADEISASAMAHEVGHNHGRNHAPCAPGNQISGVDSSYPYTGAQIGKWGFDPRKKTFFDPTKTTDIMGYCDPKWISDYTYKGLVNRVATINGNKLEVIAPGSLALYWVMILDAAGPRWSQPFPEPGEAFGEAESADVLDIDGHPITQVTVYRTRIADSTSSTLLVPPPESGWVAVRVANADPLPFTAPVSVPAPR